MLSKISERHSEIPNLYQIPRRVKFTEIQEKSSYGTGVFQSNKGIWYYDGKYGNIVTLFVCQSSQNCIAQRTSPKKTMSYT